jgi:hypothetical protein
MKRGWDMWENREREMRNTSKIFRYETSGYLDIPERNRKIIA